MTPEYPAIELLSAGKHGSGNGAKHLFKVEVRTSFHEPKVLGNFVIDHCWRTLPIVAGRTQWGTNIPVRGWDRDGLDHGLLPYVVAEAHRWAFLAHLEASDFGGSLCIQTRLVEVKFSYTYSTDEIGVSPVKVAGFRSSDLFTPRIPPEAPEDGKPQP